MQILNSRPPILGNTKNLRTTRHEAIRRRDVDCEPVAEIARSFNVNRVTITRLTP